MTRRCAPAWGRRGAPVRSRIIPRRTWSNARWTCWGSSLKRQRMPPTPIRRALISVSDKTGLIGLAEALVAHGAEILSTGGSARVLREAGVDVREVSEHSGFPEILDGRVKTLV